MANSILVNGLNYLTGKPIISSMNEEDFTKKIQGWYVSNYPQINTFAQRSLYAMSFKGTVKRRIVDLGDPKVAGWTFIVSKADPNLDKIIDIIKPLAELRGMDQPKSPLLLGNISGDWNDWLRDNYYKLELLKKKVPHYVLIIGGPDKIPFKLQEMFGTAASVGRLDFDSLDDLKSYVTKIVRLERSSDSNVQKEALVFAPDFGYPDPTYFSHNYMAKPIANHISQDLKFNVIQEMGDDATKKNLIELLKNKSPAMVFSASHGVAAPHGETDLATQKRVNGAICCQQISGEPFQNSLFTADDVPADGSPFLEGSVFFEFACFGYGTPAKSDFSHWNNESPINSDVDFVAALPKRLLAHPRGPKLFIGHLDAAYLNGFDDPNNPFPLDQWNNRIQPFVHLVNTLLDDVNPGGLAMEDISKNYNLCNAMLTSDLDNLKKTDSKDLPAFYGQISELFITRNDAQNYMIFGDPAASLHIES